MNFELFISLTYFFIMLIILSTMVNIRNSFRKSGWRLFWHIKKLSAADAAVFISEVIEFLKWLQW